MYVQILNNMKFLVTGAAGFIGMHTSSKLLKLNYQVVGIDNLNNYYSKRLKLDRLKILKKFKKFNFFKINIESKTKLENIFSKFKPTHVLHFAAQPGVRYSLKNPEAYTKSNLVGFSNILEICRNKKIKHLVLASSSSVYGGIKKFPFSESQNVDKPISFYAATKKSNELMAHAYSHLYKIPVTCLRFFTVYGPFGRPDMSPFLFTKAINNGIPIKVFNKGKMFRDFTYIEDIVEAIIKISKKPPKITTKTLAPYKIFNIGNNKPINLITYINIIEKALGKKGIKKYFPMQKGDMKYTHANISQLKSWIKFKPKTNMNKGISNFIKWYRNYYK